MEIVELVSGCGVSSSFLDCVVCSRIVELVWDCGVRSGIVVLGFWDCGVSWSSDW